jgi:hypothetical protein
MVGMDGEDRFEKYRAAGNPPWESRLKIGSGEIPEKPMASR